MHLNFVSALGVLLAVIVLMVVFTALAGLAARYNCPPVAIKPAGLNALEAAENRALQQLLDDIFPRGGAREIETEPPPDPNAPTPSGTRLYNNLLDNLLSSLHYYFRVPEETAPSRFVTSWDADTGSRVLGESRLLALEHYVSYLLTLELYRRQHAKAVFDEDLVFARSRVREIFAEEWHTVVEWPLGVYFDLVALWEVTGDEEYLEWADHYAAGKGPEDINTPLRKARSLAFKFQYETARASSPFYFYHAALLADWGRRNDPAALDQARVLFQGLRELLYDPRFEMLWKQVSVPRDLSPSRNITQTFDTLEQLSAIHAIVEYGRASGDPEALSLAQVMLQAVWDVGSPLLIPPPEEFTPSTFYGLYTAYDFGREATRLEPGELTIVQILLFEANVLVNEDLRGELRGDVDFLASWLEGLGPLYREGVNGYYTTYGDDWAEPEERLLSAKAAIWMAKALAEDEWYRYRTARAMTIRGTELIESGIPVRE